MTNLNKYDIYDIIYEAVSKSPIINGVHHLQLEQSIVSINNPNYYYLDAIYIGNDKKLYFIVSDIDGDCKTVDISDIKIEDMYHLLRIIRL